MSYWDILAVDRTQYHYVDTINISYQKKLTKKKLTGYKNTALYRNTALNSALVQRDSSLAIKAHDYG